MTGTETNRRFFYSRLLELEQRAASELRQSLGLDLSAWQHPSTVWAIDGLGTRVYRVKSAITESENLALRHLQTKLNGIEIRAVWPILRELCHDCALYLGGGALTGGVIGAGGGAFLGGVGAIPGAIAGAASGAQVGNAILAMLGLKSLVAYMAESLPTAAREYQQGFELAWGRTLQSGHRNAWGAIELYPGDFDVDNNTYLAAAAFARGHETIVLALLAAMVAYLTKGRGNLAALVQEVRRSGRLGPKMASWLEQHADRLEHLPLLQEHNRGGGAFGPAPSGGVGGAPKTASGAVKSIERDAQADVKQQAPRTAAELAGKSQGGPGIWNPAPKRIKGVDYQEQITGVQRGLEYDVPYAGTPSGKVRFDGYDAERKVLLDAKDWPGYPPEGTAFWVEKTEREMRAQIGAAQGTPIEWHFSSPESLEAVRDLLETKRLSGITPVYTPKQ